MVDLKEHVESQGFKVVHIKTDSIKIPGATPDLIKDVTEFGRKYGYDFEHESTYEKFVLFNDAVYVAREDGKWSATGKQFQHPVVFKSLFSHEEIEHGDYVEVKQVSKGHMYLVSEVSGVRQFVGRFGAFVPVLGGRSLLRIDGDKEHAVADTKGFLWELDDVEAEVDMRYFQEKVDVAIRDIEKHIPYSQLVE